MAKGKFSKSFDVFANNGLLKKSDYITSIENISFYDAKAINCIKKNAISVSDKIQLPFIGFSLYSESLYNQQIVHSLYSSRAWLYSKSKLEKALGEISLLVSPSAYNSIFEANKFYVKKGFYDLFNKEYETLAINQLEIAHNNAGLRFYIVEGNRDDLNHTLLCTGDLFYVYDLTKL